VSFVKACVSLEKNQKEFLKKSDYSLSKIVQNRINELMESEGHDLRSEPSEEPQERGSIE